MHDHIPNSRTTSAYRAINEQENRARGVAVLAWAATSALVGGAAALLALLGSARAQTPAESLPPMFELPSAGAPSVPASPGPSAARIEGGFHDPGADLDQPRVVGGKPASQNDWPSLVLVRYQDRATGKGFSCGGSVIAPDWILTAAHCASGSKAENFTIVEGTNRADTGGQQIGVSQVIVHENYTSNPPHNDVALLHLKTPARSPAQLLTGAAAVESLTPSGTSVSVAGFGLISPQPVQGQHTGAASNELLEVGFPLVDRDSCTRILAKHYGNTISRVIDAATICAGDTKGGKDSCNGDSGGPLVIKAADLKADERRAVQVGVVSWGPGCAQPDTVGVYASVANFEPWIKQHVPAATFYSKGGNVNTAAKPNTTPSIAAIEAAAVAVAGNANIRVEIVEGNRPRVGSLIHFRVVSPITGQLLVYNIDLQSGKAYQVFPNRYSGRGLQIAAGGTVTVPNSSSQFSIRVKEPLGRNRLYAFVLPPNIRIEDIAQKGLDMNDLADAPALFNALADRAERGVEVVASRTDRGAAVYEYEITR
jgi:secreted trypsin-like serine protease